MRAAPNASKPRAELDEAERLLDPNIGALTQIVEQYKPTDTPVVVTDVVRDIDAIVKQVTYTGWNETQAGDKTVRKEIRLVLKKYAPAGHRAAVRQRLRLHPRELLMSYQVVDISDWPADSDEELGARDKLWVSSTPSEEVPDALWKEGRPGDKVTEARADLWAEKIAAEVAALMGVPAARRRPCPAWRCLRRSQLAHGRHTHTWQPTPERHPPGLPGAIEGPHRWVRPAIHRAGTGAIPRLG